MTPSSASRLMRSQRMGGWDEFCRRPPAIARGLGRGWVRACDWRARAAATPAAFALARAFPGRFRPGIGLGLAHGLHQLELYPKSQLAAVRESIGAVRALLAGESVEQAGEAASFRGVSLAYPLSEPLPLKARPAEPLPGPSDWSFELIERYHKVIRDTAERFREGGTFHVLVISGLHVAFVGGLAWAAARRFTRRRLAQWALSVAFVWAFAVGVGASHMASFADAAFVGPTTVGLLTAARPWRRTGAVGIVLTVAWLINAPLQILAAAGLSVTIGTIVFLSLLAWVFALSVILVITLRRTPAATPAKVAAP